MRASSLSSPQVIDLLDRYFVPVLFSLDDYHHDKKGKKNEEEWARIRALARSHGYPKGTVCVYLIDTKGDVIESMLVDQAMQPNKLVPMLKRAIEREKVEPRGQPARRTSLARAAGLGSEKPSAQKIHIWTRNLGSNWSLGVGEDRIDLTPEEWTAFLPAPRVVTGQSWSIPRKVADKIYPYFFPPIKNYNAANSVILKASLTATAASVSKQEIRLTLHGALEMDHPLRDADKPSPPGAKTNGRIRAAVVGSAVIDRDAKKVRVLQLLADNADYIWHWQGKPVNSNFVAAAELEP